MRAAGEAGGAAVKKPRPLTEKELERLLMNRIKLHATEEKRCVTHRHYGEAAVHAGQWSEARFLLDWLKSYRHLPASKL